MRHRCAGSRHPSIECLKSTRFIHDRQTMCSMLGHDLQGLTYFIAGSANGKLPAHDFAYQEIGRSLVLGCQGDEQIAIRNHPNPATTGFDNGREPQPLFHIFSPAAAAFVPEEQEDTSFVIISLTCIVLLLFAAFVAQRANWQLPSKQKAIEGGGSLKRSTLYRAPAPSSCALVAALSRVLNSGYRRP